MSDMDTPGTGWGQEHIYILYIIYYILYIISAVVKLLLQNIYFCVLSRISCNIGVGSTIIRDLAIYVVNRLVLTEVIPVGTF